MLTSKDVVVQRRSKNAKGNDHSFYMELNRGRAGIELRAFLFYFAARNSIKSACANYKYMLREHSLLCGPQLFDVPFKRTLQFPVCIRSTGFESCFIIIVPDRWIRLMVQELFA